MKVCVVGLWHLGSVTSACLARLGHQVVGLDVNAAVIADLSAGRAPLFEAGLNELVASGLAEGKLAFSTDPAAALRDAEVVWITYDTPVDDDDVADVDGVVEQIAALFPHVSSGALMLVSSQLVAGCTRGLEERFKREHPGKMVVFGYSPENLRLGRALEVFLRPDRVVVGVRNAHARATVERLLQAFVDRIVWMSVESAEMTKHALNAFLAMSVSFANEVAAICEEVGADAKEVERGLKSEQRIGPSAYLAAGAAFAGGTLARDVQYLRRLAQEHGRSAALLGAIKESNDQHKGWMRRKLSEFLGKDLAGRRVAVLGLTYKPGTDTLRRSTAVELCDWLLLQGADVVAHDPRVSLRPQTLDARIALESSTLAAIRDADAAVVATQWADFRTIEAADLRKAMRRPLVIDANRFLAKALESDGIEYHAVGTPSRAIDADTRTK